MNRMAMKAQEAKLLKRFGFNRNISAFLIATPLASCIAAEDPTPGIRGDGKTGSAASEQSVVASTDGLTASGSAVRHGGGIMLNPAEARPIPQRTEAIPPTAKATAPASDSRSAVSVTTSVSDRRTAMSVTASAAPVVPACSGNIINTQGVIIAKPNTSMIFWGSAWNTNPNSTRRTTISANTQWLTTTCAFWNRLLEYGVSAGGSYRGTFTNTSLAGTGTLSEATIQSGITATLNNVAHITPGASDIYVVMLPPGVASQVDVDRHFGGHHDHYSQTFGTTTVDVKYAVIEPTLGDPSTAVAVSHELAEAATDPTFAGWAEPITGDEIADLCQGAAFGLIGNRPVSTIWSQESCSCQVEKDLNFLDFDGDGTTNLTIFRAGVWFANGGSPDWNFLGNGTDIPYGGDYNGDGRTEFSLFRDGQPGTVFTLDVKTGVSTPNTFGTTGDKPVPGDYDGDGLTDLAVWTPTTAIWTWKSTATGVVHTQQWGSSDDIPVPGDYDGDHKTDFVVVQPSTHKWWIIQSSDGRQFSVTWDVGSGDIPVPADFNGDNKFDFAYWRPSTGEWHVTYNGTNLAFIQQWGQSGDIPVAIDYDNDFKADMAVWRPSDAKWYILNSSTGTDTQPQWGQNGDVPVQRGIIRP